MHDSSRFNIAIVGSGPIGKLLLSSVKSHPRITYSQYEADTLPLRPSFGYGVGPQTLRAAAVINPELGRELRNKCFLGPVWMNFYHGGDEDRLLEPVMVPESQGGLYGRLGRQELMEMLDSFVPSEHETQYGKRLSDISVTKDDDLQLNFQDGTLTHADAIWGCDGMNSLCRSLIQGSKDCPKYSGMMAFRGRVPARSVREEVGQDFDKQTFMCLGVKGWNVLVFPIDNGEFINIAAFCVDLEHTKKGRDHIVTLDEVRSYFPGRNQKVDHLLELLVRETPGGPQRLELASIGTLPSFFSRDLQLTTFGDAAHGMLPHIAGSMSTGFIGAALFIRELNGRIACLSDTASKADVSRAVMEAAAVYDAQHRPLAQQIHDHSAEQGMLWSSGLVNVDELSRRPLHLWQAANHLSPDGNI